MKKTMLQLWMLNAMLWVSMPISAYDFELDGIYYDVISLDDMTCNIAGCSSDITELILPASLNINGRTLKVCGVNKSAFSENSTLASVTFSPGISTIGTSAFEDCSNLSKINLGTIKIIHSSAFCDCPQIQEITVPGSVDTIYDDAFSISKWRNEKNIDIKFESGPNILVGKDNVFYKRLIKSVDLDRNLKGFEKSWNEYSREPFNASIGENVTIYPSYFGCYLKENIDLSNTNITEIDNYAFYKNISNEILLPPNLTKIGDNAFESCSFTEMALPDGITTIGNDAFKYCGELKGGSIN